MILNIRLVSVDKKRIKQFILFLKTHILIQKLKLKFVLLESSKKVKNYSILKSPHVHKTAWEHFSITYFILKVSVLSYISIEKTLRIFKNIQDKIFTGIKFKFSIQLYYFYKNNRKKNNFLFLINSFSSEKKICYLKIFEVIGRIRYSH